MNALRHRWVKIKLHNYVCRRCGARKVNVEKSPGLWVQEWHLPDGSVREAQYAPSCEPGPRTAERLVWLSEHQARLAAAAGAEVSES